MTRVAILWHMHQPYYEDLVTREHILPWVRLHALKDYWGMASLLEEFPDVRVTFNLVPSLLVQLEAFASNTAQDRVLETGLKPADALTPDDVRFMLRNFFHAQRQRMIDIHPRYAELLALRGWGSSDAELDVAARRFGVEELRDLQVWQKLAWIDPEYHAKDARVRGLLDRGRRFSEDDKRLLREVELELLNAVIPTYRKGADAGRIELSTSPFYHPILPLLCDTDIFKHTHPASPSPRQRFTRPEDALLQLQEAAAYHERLFGRKPVGVWPSEGSVSDAVVPLIARAGFQWMATDEMILANTLGTTFGRDGSGRVEQAHRLYRPYAVDAGGASVACGFRDHALSDLIGFVYAGWTPDVAAEDFVGRLVEAGRQAARDGGGEPTIFVILDGENAWEHFEGGGRPFLRALYGRLSGHPELRSVTMAEACAEPVSRLNGIFPGSWIDANFYIWIGHHDDQLAWSQVADARKALDEASGEVDAETLARARQEVLIAEGSDWCWWYGDDHSSDHDAEFDDLFRRHLRNVYRLLRRPIPDELFLSNISSAAQPLAVLQPTGLLTPTIDGTESSYFEWMGAGRLDVRSVAGAMHQVERDAALLTHVYFGFDDDAFYVRVDGAAPVQDLMAGGFGFTTTFLEPRDRRLVCRLQDGRLSATCEARVRDRWVQVHGEAVTAAADVVLEARIPLGLLRSSTTPTVSFFVAVIDAAGNEVERQPSGRPIATPIPDASFAARNWTA